MLTDDLSWNLLPYMPQVQALQREGTTLRRYFVTDSLCCPSRASIFTGRYPHSTGVLHEHAAGRRLRRVPPDRGAEHVRHQPAGGGLPDRADGQVPQRLRAARRGRRFVPPGWTAWAVGRRGYPQFDYNLLERSPAPRRPRSSTTGAARSDYLTDVISRRGQQFIAGAVSARRPFLLELATFAPHAPVHARAARRERVPGR